MWSDNDIDKAFQRLNPSEPEPTPFPLDAWLQLETELDKVAIERTVRHKLWRYLAVEVAIVALIALGWWLWRASPATPTGATATLPHLNGPAPALTTAATAKKSRHVTDSKAAVNPSGSGAAPSGAIPAGTAMAPGAAGSSSGVSSRPVVGSAAGAPVAREAGAPMASQVAATPMPRLLVGATPEEHRKQAASRALTTEKPIARRHLTPNLITTSASPSAVHQRKEYAPSTARPVADLAAASASADGGTATPTGLNAPASNRASLPSIAALRRHGHGQAHQQHKTGGTLETTSAAAATPTLGVAGGVQEHTAAITTSLGILALRPVPLLLAAASEEPVSLAGVALKDAHIETVLPVRWPRFYLGLVGAPDVSTVKFAGVQRPLPNVGITFDYRLTSRLRLTTGLLRSTKAYRARRDDYDWGTSPQPPTRDFTWVDGTCTVLDIPLNLRYTLLMRPQYQVFGSAGLSTFFMQRERYTYRYTNYNGPTHWQRVAVNENQHPFSILNLSFGYERRLSNHWQVLAEPYLKLPLGGVGVGKVQLLSGGVFLGIKHGF